MWDHCCFCLLLHARFAAGGSVVKRPTAHVENGHVIHFILTHPAALCAAETHPAKPNVVYLLAALFTAVTLLRSTPARQPNIVFLLAEG